MTQQFKFGDRVRHKEHGESVVVWTTDDTADQWVEVAYQNGKTEAYPNTDLELIPHPDTVRLDWIEKQRATLYHNAREDIKHGIAPVEVKAAAQSEYFGGSTVRQAIDTAMREKAA